MMPEEVARAFANVKRDTDSSLARLFSDQIKRAGKIDGAYKKLISDTAKQVTRGGKRVRPYFAWLGYKAAGGNDQEAIARLGLAIELFHNYLLVHDDVMDRDDRRHGMLNTIGLARKRLSKTNHPNSIEHVAESFGILSGDILNGFSQAVIIDLMISEDIKRRLQKSFEQLTFEVAAGQQMDMLLSLESKLDLKKILKTYHYKTATCTVIYPLEMGAILAGANEKVISILREFGTKCGIAFQLVDDVLGMFGSAKALGKPVISDLREGKKTVLMYYGLKFASEADRKVLLDRLGEPKATMSDLKLVKNILSQSGAKAKTIFLAQQYIDEAKQALKKVEFPGGAKQQLEVMAEYLVSREK